MFFTCLQKRPDDFNLLHHESCKTSTLFQFTHREKRPHDFNLARSVKRPYDFNLPHWVTPVKSVLMISIYPAPWKASVRFQFTALSHSCEKRPYDFNLPHCRHWVTPVKSVRTISIYRTLDPTKNIRVINYHSSGSRKSVRTISIYRAFYEVRTAVNWNNADAFSEVLFVVNWNRVDAFSEVRTPVN